MQVPGQDPFTTFMHVLGTPMRAFNDSAQRPALRAFVAKEEAKLVAAAAAGEVPELGVTRAQLAAARDGLPLLLVSGFGASADSWAVVSAALKHEGIAHEIWEPPVNGFGFVHDAADALQAHLPSVLAEHGVGAVQLVGHSKGGPIVSEVARRELALVEQGGGAGTGRVASVATIASPNLGLVPKGGLDSPAARALQTAASDTGAGTVEIYPGPFIDSVQAAKLPEHVPFTSIYANGDDGIVSPSMAHQPGAANVPVGSEADHPDHMGLLADPHVIDALVVHAGSSPR